MLSLKNIIKDYAAGDSTVRALDGVTLDFRENEFVSILGPSGCGKTTLLNIIGGLDQYTSGDLVINGISTKKYKDADWDSYRNHSIGFVFQSYNLIPHQTVLANVELALTLSGISRRERRRRAIDALRQVGLGNQLRKKPNQMSGGQMQRVAIARALVNDPDILLADEPTGALDTQTSIQIMDILRSISKKKLIIMVTHNPDLATQYSTRIIRVLDGKVTDDSMPYTPAPAAEEHADAGKKKTKKKFRNIFGVGSDDVRRGQIGGTGIRINPISGKKKRSMSFFTALSLSLNNLMTKKGRTIMTSFAGSIGIIGIALILSVSTGVNNYIDSIQRDTLASYPIQLQAESMDLSALISALMSSDDPEKQTEHEEGRVYESAVIAQLLNSLNSAESTTNDLHAFRKYLMENPELFADYLTAVQYKYDFDWTVLTQDADGKVIKSDVMELFAALSGSSGQSREEGWGSGSPFGGSSGSSLASGYNVWQEMLRGDGDDLVSSIIREEYDLIYGDWPTAYNEIMLVVDENNEISDLSLYALGLRTRSEIIAGMISAGQGEILDLGELGSWTYEELCDMTFRLTLNSQSYQLINGAYVNMSKSEEGLNYLYSIGVPLKIVGILRPNEDATSTVLNGTIAYTAALTDYAIAKTAESTLLAQQLANPETDILTGLPFPTGKELTDEEKQTAVLAYLDSLTVPEKAQICREFLAKPTDEETAEKADQLVTLYTGDDETVIMNYLVTAAVERTGMSEEMITTTILGMYPTPESRRAALTDGMKEVAVQMLYAENLAQLALMDDASVLNMVGSAGLTSADYAAIYDEKLAVEYSESTYKENLRLLGYVDREYPDAINLYASTFENKDQIAALIRAYNDTVDEEQQISYTDYVALMMSSVTTIVNAISYVLIAFVAISLVVSSIMIGIITYISVLERTKEIGILRAIGASKKDVGRVFNAETLIVGFVAGMIGVLMTLLFNGIINIILYALTGIAALKAVLPVGAAVVLVAISMFLTFIAGLFPSGFAAKRNPVEALRSE